MLVALGWLFFVSRWARQEDYVENEGTPKMCGCFSFSWLFNIYVATTKPTTKTTQNFFAWCEIIIGKKKDV